MRTRAYRRKMRNKSINRKKNISKHVFGFDWYSVDGKYSKGKIHCSCPLCTYSKLYDLPRITDERDKIKVQDAMKDYYATA